MKRVIPIILFSIFTFFNISLIYGMYTCGTQLTISIVEEEENHIKILEVKHYLKKESPAIVLFKSLEEKSKHSFYLKLNKYEDVYLASVESPPDFMC